MISLGSIRTEERNGETVIPDDEEDKLLDKLADKVADRIGESEVEVRSTEDNPALADVWLAGIPMGKLLDKALQNSREAGSSSSEPTRVTTPEPGPKTMKLPLWNESPTTTRKTPLASRSVPPLTEQRPS